jgi:translation initiation factor IF-3
VRVIGPDNKQVGVMTLNDALNLARQHEVDLVEISPNAVPPVCRVVDFGKYRYEMAKKEKDSKKHQHASTVKEVQLSPRIDPHDLGIKTEHAVGFLCEDMKVKISLKFRGREMAHTEFGFDVIKKFLTVIAPFGHPDFPPKLIGRGINVMVSPLPRSKRPKNPYGSFDPDSVASETSSDDDEEEEVEKAPAVAVKPAKVPVTEEPKSGGLANPFANLDVKPS